MTARTDHKISLGFTGGMVLFAIAALLAVTAMQRVLAHTVLATRSYAAREELRTLDVEYAEAKAAVRSYLLTSDPRYVALYRAELDTARRTYARLLANTRDSAQLARLRAVGPLLVAREQSLEGLRELGPEAVTRDSAAVRSNIRNGQRLSILLGEAIAAMTAAEQAKLDLHARAQYRSEHLLEVLLLVFAVVGGVVLWMMRRSVGRDMLARERAEVALRESEARFAGIISLAGDVIVTVDESQCIRLFNRGAERVFGYTANEALGKPLELLLPDDAAPRHAAMVRHFGAESEPSRRMGERRNVTGRRRNGEEFPADASISKLRTSDGWLYTVVLRDVTEERRITRDEHVLAEASRALADSLDYDTILETVAAVPVPDVGDWTLVDIVEEVDGAGRRLRRVASRHADPTIDAALRALESWQLTDDSPSRVLDVIRTGRAELVDVDEDWLEAHSDPEVFPAARAAGARSVIIVPLTVAHRVLGTISIARRADRPPLDETDLALGTEIAARAALAIENARNFRRAQLATAARDEVLNVVSHDLRNPLAAVAMTARTLLDRPDVAEAERTRLYHSALEAVEWMNRLVQDLLDSASIDAGRLSIDVEPQSVPALVDSVIDLFAARAANAGISLSVAVDPSTPLVAADPQRILQVLSNLVSNALKYTPAGGCVTVGSELHDGEVRIVVRDTGAGIAPEHIPRLFDRFWTLRGASRTPGTGLGLPIAKGIIAAHGGRLWVESAVGQGSAFWFSLPLAPRSVAMPATPVGPLVDEAAAAR